MKYILYLSCFTLITACTVTEESSNEESSSLPNIIIILADDLGYGDLSGFNPQSKIQTPAIDKIGSEGMIFTNAHSPGNWCTPSRYGLLTGTYPMRINQEDRKNDSRITDRQMTLGKLLKSRGYNTGCVGKWHLGFKGISKPNYAQRINNGPTDRGFDYFFGIHASLDIPPYYYIENDSVVVAPTDSIGDNYSDGWTKVQGAFWRGGKIAPGYKHDEVLDIFKEKAIGFIEEKSKQENPFFLYFPLTAPHTPWLPGTNDKGKSQAGMYGDFVVKVDNLVDEIDQKLSDLGIKENTLVIFSSDNGPVWFEQDISRFNHESTGKFRGLKADLWEGAHHIPMLIRWPEKVQAGSTTDEITNFTDFLATFASISGTEINSGEFPDSYDLSPLLFGEPDKYLRNSTVIMDNVIISKEWKLIDGKAKGWLNRLFNDKNDRFDDHMDSTFLYNMSEDAIESKNLALEKKEIVEMLKAKMDSIKNIKTVF